MIRVLPLTCSLAVSIASSGCVIPAAPEWSDPDRNYPPTIASATPAVGTPLGQAYDASGPAVEVKVELADQNAGDKLYLRWIIDYPPYSPANTVLDHEDIKPGGDRVLRPAVAFAPECAADHLSHGVSDHRLMLAVSDRKFKYEVDDPFATVAPDAVDEGNFVIKAVWPFTLDCQ